MILLKDRTKIEAELAVANAHPLGARPFERVDYIRKFENLTEGLISSSESQRFLNLVQNLPELTATEVASLNVALDDAELVNLDRDNKGIF